MIKLVSLVIFALAFFVSWSLFNCKEGISLETHAGIQSKFISLIEESVKAARPNITKFEIDSIFTTKIDANQLNAHFSYRYMDSLENADAVQQMIEGDAVLVRGVSEDPQKEVWVVRSVKTNNTSIDFIQGMTVQPETASASSADTTLNSPPPETKPQH